MDPTLWKITFRWVYVVCTCCLSTHLIMCKKNTTFTNRWHLDARYFLGLISCQNHLSVEGHNFIHFNLISYYWGWLQDFSLSYLIITHFFKNVYILMLNYMTHLCIYIYNKKRTQSTWSYSIFDFMLIKGK